MKKLFVPYETAFQLKEKGFDEQCFFEFNKSKELIPLANDGEESEWMTLNNTEQAQSGDISAPLYQQVVDWFREKHKIVIEVQLDQTLTLKYCIQVVKWNGFSDFKKADIPMEKWGFYRNYYEALNIAIEEAFKLI